MKICSSSLAMSVIEVNLLSGGGCRMTYLTDDATSLSLNAFIFSKFPAMSIIAGGDRGSAALISVYLIPAGMVSV